MTIQIEMAPQNWTFYYVIGIILFLHLNSKNVWFKPFQYYLPLKKTKSKIRNSTLRYLVPKSATKKKKKKSERYSPLSID